MGPPRRPIARAAVAVQCQLGTESVHALESPITANAVFQAHCNLGNAVEVVIEIEHMDLEKRRRPVFVERGPVTDVDGAG